MQVSIVSYSEVIKDNDSFRIDAEFFKKDILKLESKIKQNKWDYLGNLSQSIINFGAYSLCNNIVFKKEGVPYLNVGDISIGIIHYTNAVKIDKNLSINILSKSLVKDNQVLLTIAGTIGNAAIAFDPPIATNSNQAIANIEIKKSLSPFYTAIYLNCKYGKGQSKRLTISSVQPNLLLTQVKRIKTFIPSNSFQLYIELIYKNTLTIHKLSRKLYQEAEKLLLEELGLLDYKAKHTLTFVKNFSDTKEAGRIDAEYFQPKYDEIINAIKSYKDSYRIVNDVVEIKDKNYKPKGEKEYKYIELSNISSTGEITGYTEKLGKGLPTRAKRQIKHNDVIMSSIEGSLDSIALITEDWNNGLCSTGFYIIHSKHFNSETLLVLLKSIVGQMQLKKGCSGTILTAISKDELQKIIIPLINKKVQNKIKDNITKMYELQKQSKQLLGIAKTGVEKAIEQDEEKALSWMDKEVAKLGINLG